ncbi:hypothetical protein IJ732_00580 [bacterium]|nr:hypothetical protein [bacterium]
MGKDVFGFWFSDDGVIPKGAMAFETNGVRDRDKFSQTCSTSGGNCTAWVIYNDNMDYLTCDDLSWSGKRKCD